MKTLKLDGITYNVIGIFPVSGINNRFQYEIRRLNGKRSYWAILYENGVFGKAI